MHSLKRQLNYLIRTARAADRSGHHHAADLYTASVIRLSQQMPPASAEDHLVRQQVGMLYQTFQNEIASLKNQLQQLKQQIQAMNPHPQQPQGGYDLAGITGSQNVGYGTNTVNLPPGSPANINMVDPGDANINLL